MWYVMALALAWFDSLRHISTTFSFSQTKTKLTNAKETYITQILQSTQHDTISEFSPRLRVCLIATSILSAHNNFTSLLLRATVFVVRDGLWLCANSTCFLHVLIYSATWSSVFGFVDIVDIVSKWSVDQAQMLLMRSPYTTHARRDETTESEREDAVGVRVNAVHGWPMDLANKHNVRKIYLLSTRM